MMLKRITGYCACTYFVAAFLTISCNNKTTLLSNTASQTIKYAESTEDFPNPERGFYQYSDVHSNNFIALTEAELRRYRAPHPITKGNFQVSSTLVFRYYILDDVTNSPIGNSFFSNIKKDFDAARAAGVKLIPRFTYTINAKAGNCPEGFICPPYGDAPKAIILNHVAQLKPVLQENADVIACVQLGFIGTWGEQYYSDFFGDASSNGSQGNKLTDTNWKDRIEVIRALLDAVPSDRMIQVRYPQIKQRFVYGVNSSLTSAPLTEADAFTEKDIARLGYHNDCFMASPDDYGTYQDYGNSSGPRISGEAAMKTLKDYYKTDSKFVLVGGETCSNDFSPANDCEPAGRIQAEFSALHYSFINANYNTAVINDWQDGGCMDNIKRNLGYRFILQTASIPDHVAKGSLLAFVLEIKNGGYASCYNKRVTKLILRNTKTNEIKSFNLKTDVRRWYSGSNTVKESITIPSDLATGTYELLLNLPDAYPAIASKPEFSIRFANENLWEPSTGFNKLNHTLKVD